MPGRCAPPQNWEGDMYLFSGLTWPPFVLSHYKQQAMQQEDGYVHSFFHFVHYCFTYFSDAHYSFSLLLHLAFLDVFDLVSYACKGIVEHVHILGLVQGVYMPGRNDFLWLYLGVLWDVKSTNIS